MLVVLSIVIFVLIIFIVSYHIFISYLRWTKINQQLRALRNHKHRRVVKAPAAAAATIVPPAEKLIPASNTKAPAAAQTGNVSPPSTIIGARPPGTAVETFNGAPVAPPTPEEQEICFPKPPEMRSPASPPAAAVITPVGGVPSTVIPSLPPPSSSPTPTAPPPAPAPTLPDRAAAPATGSSSPPGGSCNISRNNNASSCGSNGDACCDTENNGIQNNNNIEIVITDKRNTDDDVILGHGGVATTCDEARRMFIHMYPEVASMQVDPWSYFVEHGAEKNMQWPGPDCPSLNWSFYPVCSVPFDAHRVGTYRDDIGRWIGTDPNHGNRTCKFPVGSTDEGMLDYTYASSSYDHHDGEYNTYASTAIDAEVALPRTLYDTPYIVYEPRQRTVPTAYTMVA